jgi:hypothetical protein
MNPTDRIIKMDLHKKKNYRIKKVTFDIYREIIYIPNFKYHKFARLLWWSKEEISTMVINCKQDLIKIKQTLPHIDTKLAIQILCEQ